MINGVALDGSPAVFEPTEFPQGHVTKDEGLSACRTKSAEGEAGVLYHRMVGFRPSTR
jgi:hypothetical protein